MAPIGVARRAWVGLLAIVALSACQPRPAAATDPAPAPAVAAPGAVAAAPTPMAVPAAVIPPGAPPDPVPGPRQPLKIATAAGVVALQVEFADTEASRERGLMYRRKMAPNDGMLFDFKTPRAVYFWMKNTYIPLDMVFIGPDARIVGIAYSATPLSEEPVGPGNVPVLGVLEIGAGRADALNIRAGDIVDHPMFKSR